MTKLLSALAKVLTRLGELMFHRLAVIAALIVIPVAIKTKSLVWSIVAGVGSYGLLLLI